MEGTVLECRQKPELILWLGFSLRWRNTPVLLRCLQLHSCRRQKNSVFVSWLEIWHGRFWNGNGLKHSKTVETLVTLTNNLRWGLTGCTLKNMIHLQNFESACWNLSSVIWFFYFPSIFLQLTELRLLCCDAYRATKTLAKHSYLPWSYLWLLSNLKTKLGYLTLPQVPSNVKS